MNDHDGQSDHFEQACPECHAPRSATGAPSCDCGRRVADAAQEIRTAEAAAAEDFDPLRIRPYVSLDGPSADGSGRAEGAGQGSGAPEGAAGAAGAAPGEREDFLYGAPAPPPPPNVSDTAPISRTVTSAAASGPRGEPDSATDLGPSVGRAEAPAPGRLRRRPLVLLGTAAAAVAVVTSAWFANGLLNQTAPADGRAVPQDVRVSAPTSTSAAPSPSSSAPTPSQDPTPTKSSPGTPTTSHPAPPPSPRPASPTPSRSSEPTRSEPSAEPTPTNAEPSGDSRDNPPVLGPGDTGDEVVELQERLTEVSMFVGEANGSYDIRTEDAVRRYQIARTLDVDDPGVYDRVTRKSLEAETKELAGAAGSERSAATASATP